MDKEWQIKDGGCKREKRETECHWNTKAYAETFFNYENWRVFNGIVKSGTFKNLSSALRYEEIFWINIWGLPLPTIKFSSPLFVGVYFRIRVLFNCLCEASSRNWLKVLVFISFDHFYFFYIFTVRMQKRLRTPKKHGWHRFIFQECLSINYFIKTLC